MANTSGFNWLCPLLPTDLVWEEGIIAGVSLPLWGISGSPMAQLEALCGSNPQATPRPESPDISIALY